MYKIDTKISDVQAELARLRVDFAEAEKIISEPFPQEQELKDKEDRLKTLTEELNKAAAEAKKNAPKKEKTCYFALAKLKKEAMKRRTQGKGKDKTEEKKPQGDSID